MGWSVGLTSKTGDLRGEHMKDVWVHDIVNGITAARSYAESFAEQRPEVNEPVQKLLED
jgi:hypothetical protein